VVRHNTICRPWYCHRPCQRSVGGAAHPPQLAPGNPEGSEGRLMIDLHPLAKYYAALGLVVIPLNGKNRSAADGKKPPIPTDAAIDIWPLGCNFGIVAGANSGNLIPIDFDG